MIRQGHIDGAEATALLTFALMTKAFLNFPRVIAEIGLTGGWLLMIMQGVVGAIAAAPLVMLLGRFPGNSWDEISQALLGRFLGKVVIGFFWLYFLVTTSLQLREFAGAFTISVLPTTPVTFSMFLGVTLGVLAAMSGLETIARISVLLTLPLAMLSGLLYALSVPNVGSLLDYAPVLGPGLAELAMASLFGAGAFSELILLGYINEWLRDPKELLKVAVKSHLFAWGFLVVTVILVLGVAPIPATHRLTFPILDLARSSTVTIFLQNYEAIFVFLWLFVADLRMSIGLYVCSLAFADLFDLENLYGVILPTGVLCYGLANIPTGVLQTIVWNEELVQPWSWTLTFLPAALMLLVSLLRRKRGGRISG